MRLLPVPSQLDVILLSGADDEDVPRQGNRLFLQESGHVVMALQFKKEWSDLEVELKIREAFVDIILSISKFYNRFTPNY